jgi:hypothetical protein
MSLSMEYAAFGRAGHAEVLKDRDAILQAAARGELVGMGEVRVAHRPIKWWRAN